MDVPIWPLAPDGCKWNDKWIEEQVATGAPTAELMQQMRDEMLQCLRSLQSIVVTFNARIVELEKGKEVA